MGKNCRAASSRAEKNVKTIFPFPLAIVTGKRSKNFHFPKTLCVQKINELPNQYFYRTKSFGLDQKNKSDRLSVLCDLLAEKTETTSFFDHMREINSYRSENLELHRILFGKD